jgi:hypothetical protein
LQTPDQPFPSINSKVAKLDYNKDGSVDIYFGPKAPKGHEKNWIQTVPKKSWFLVIRLFNFCRGEGTPTYMIFVF